MLFSYVEMVIFFTICTHSNAKWAKTFVQTGLNLEYTDNKVQADTHKQSCWTQ